jgi:hypothetical protein
MLQFKQLYFLFIRHTNGGALTSGNSLKIFIDRELVYRNPSLGLVTKARVRKSASQEKSMGVWESVRINTHSPKWTPMLRVHFPKPSESDRKGKNPLPWGVLYIIGKLWNFRCPKWVRMTHLAICNTSYGQKKGRESN